MIRRTLARSLALTTCLIGLAVPAMAQSLTPVKVLLDWAWLPYHTTFLVAQEKGYYKEAGLDVQLEQGRGSATTALMLSQGGFDIAHLNVTNAAQMISKGGALKVVGIYQHKTGAAFIGIKGKVKLDGPQSLKGIKIGSTPGGSDGLSLKVFTAANKMKLTDLNVVSLDANAKTAALFGGTIDAVSGDSPAFNAYVRATNQQPETMQLSDFGVPLIGFGFAANNAYLAKNPEVVRKFLAATRKGFVEAARDYKAACELMQAKVHLAGTIERCVDYNQGILALSTPPTDASWGQQSNEEWTRLLGTLKDANELFGDKPIATYYTNDFVPK
ncbi:MAG TPA: ABC transporter substrate-binding protein [Reyranella sp.]